MTIKSVFRAVLLGAIATALVACGSDDFIRGNLVLTTKTADVTAAQIDASTAASGLAPLVGAAARCDVAIHKIRYETVGPKNDGSQASAGLMIPSGAACPGPYPTLVYHHGTTTLKAFTMSDPTNGEAGLQMAMFAAQGYVVVMPDYHGYFESTVAYHPYLHAENTAAVSIDALRAARQLLTQRTIATSGKLFLAGYSQGGHAAMATHRAMERDFPAEFAVTAAVPMSGPYALAASFLGMLDTPGQGASVFVTMAIVGYQKAYGDMYAQAQDVFQAPWVPGIESLIPGTLDSTALYTTGKLPLALTGPGGLLTDAFVTAYKASANYPARLRADQNDLLNWKPTGHTELCGGARDPTVPFANTVGASAYFGAQAVTVTAVDVELIPSFAAAIAAQVAAAPDLSTYHGTIVPPLCSSYAKNAVFDPRL